MLLAGLLLNRHHPLPDKAKRHANVSSIPSFLKNLTTPIARLHCFNRKHRSRRRSHPSICSTFFCIFMDSADFFAMRLALPVRLAPP
jgi:hypothetical protein